MKNFPGIVIVCAGIILGISGLLIFQTFAPKFAPRTGGSVVTRRFGFVIPEHEQIRDGVNFCGALKEKVSDNALYSFDVHDDNSKYDTCCNPSDCSLLRATVKVDEITTFRVAEGLASDLTPIGSHVTQRIYSDKPDDIQAVLALLKH